MKRTYKPHSLSTGNARIRQSSTERGAIPYNVHGNVWEWLEDCWHDKFDGAPTNGEAWVAAHCSDRVLRGGSWKTGPEKLGVGRYDAYAADRDSDVGFRIARPLAAGSSAAGASVSK